MTYLEFYEFCLRKRAVMKGENYGTFLRFDVLAQTMIKFKFRGGNVHTVGIKQAINIADMYAREPDLMEIIIINDQDTEQPEIAISYDVSTLEKKDDSYVLPGAVKEIDSYPSQQSLFDDDYIDVNAGEPISDHQRTLDYYASFGYNPNGTKIIPASEDKSFDQKDMETAVDDYVAESLVTVDAEEIIGVLSEELVMTVLHELYPEGFDLENEDTENLAVELMEKFTNTISEALYSNDLTTLKPNEIS